MSKLGGSNGDGWPPEGGGQSGGLPGLPPEWGTVIIPDDPSELAKDAAQVRREIRRQARHATWRRRLGLPSRTEGEQGQPSLGLPLLIMSVAMIATLTSLFAVAWPGRNSQPSPVPSFSRQAPTTSTPGSASPTFADVSTNSTAEWGAGLPNLSFEDVTGKAVPLAQLTPAAVLLVDGCAACDNLISETVRVAPGKVTVLVLGRAAPTLAASMETVKRLADPQERLRNTLGLNPPRDGLAAVVLVASGGRIAMKLAAAQSLSDFRAALSTLA